MPEVNYLHSVSWGFLKVRCQVDFVIQNTMNMYFSDKASRYSSDEVRMMSLPDEGKARLVPEKPVDVLLDIVHLYCWCYELNGCMAGCAVCGSDIDVRQLF